MSDACGANQGYRSGSPVGGEERAAIGEPLSDACGANQGYRSGSPVGGEERAATGEALTEIPTRREDCVGRYEIRVRGHLASRWGAWFDGMTLTCHDDGTTVISGSVADQSALHGLLRKLNDLGVPLVSVTPTGSDELNPR